jgi:hypothetical protein
MTRAQALDELEKEPYPLDQMEQDKDYVSKKLGITVKEFDALMELPCRSHLEYPNSKVLYDNLAFFVRLAKDKATRV